MWSCLSQSFPPKMVLVIPPDLLHIAGSIDAV